MALRTPGPQFSRMLGGLLSGVPWEGTPCPSHMGGRDRKHPESEPCHDPGASKRPAAVHAAIALMTSLETQTENLSHGDPILTILICSARISNFSVPSPHPPTTWQMSAATASGSPPLSSHVCGIGSDTELAELVGRSDLGRRCIGVGCETEFLAEAVMLHFTEPLRTQQ